MKKIRVEDIDCLNFWINYFGCCYPNGYDELNDIPYLNCCFFCRLLL